MASSDHSPADEAFERMLLHSASADGPSPEAAGEAWAKLSLAAAGATLAAGGSALAATTFAAKKGGAWVAAKWLLVGAVGGSAVTAALMHVSGSGPRAAVVASVEAPARSAVVPAPRAEPFVASPASPGSPEPPPAAVVRTPRRRTASASPAPAAVNVPRSTPPSTLGAEVALLDAARAAIARGAFDDALRLIGEYRGAFPGGALAADAEVIAIDAMAARHEDVTVRADRFLSRFPNDPHAARIRKLASGSR